MNTLIISCEMIKNELTAILEKTGRTFPVIWVPTEYHNDPDKLREKLQHEIDSAPACEIILLAFGCCGNATVGLKATTADLVIPKADDCIEILLRKENQKFERKARTYFLSKGWLESSKNLKSEYDHAQKKYGEVRADRIFKAMLKEYRYMMFIDTGLSNTSELESLLTETKQLAAILDLEVIVEKSDSWLLEKLISEHLGCDFLYVPKGQTIEMTDLTHLQQTVMI